MCIRDRALPFHDKLPIHLGNGELLQGNRHLFRQYQLLNLLGQGLRLLQFQQELSGPAHQRPSALTCGGGDHKKLQPLACCQLLKARQIALGLGKILSLIHI